MTEHEKREISFHSWGESNNFVYAIYKYRGFGGYKLLMVQKSGFGADGKDMFMMSNIPYDKDIELTWKSMK